MDLTNKNIVYVYCLRQILWLWGCLESVDSLGIDELYGMHTSTLDLDISTVQAKRSLKFNTITFMKYVDASRIL